MYGQIVGLKEQGVRSPGAPPCSYLEKVSAKKSGEMK
jgi:hypothetical protein